MKKVLLALLIASTVAFSDDDLAFRRGTSTINAGFNTYFGTYSGNARPGVLIAFDQGAFDNMFSMGGEFGLYTDRKTLNLGSVQIDSSYTHISPLFRFGFHPFGIPPLAGKVKVAKVLDPYVVGGAGFTVTVKKYEYRYMNGTIYNDKENIGDFAWTVKSGVRWFFNERANLWGEYWFGSLTEGGSSGITIGAGINF